MLKKLCLLFALLIACVPAMAQGTGGNIFWESGKIYVVIAVISIVFLGIIIYLVSIDRKVSKLEKEFKNKQ